MDRAEDILLALLRNSLWGTPLKVALSDFSQDIWESVYSLARFHAVQGVVFDAVKELPAGTGPDLKLCARWALDSRGIAGSNAHIQEVTERLAEAWNDLGIDAVHLKGVRMAAMYPVPEHRVCGDIDWYFRTDKDRYLANGWADRQGLNPVLDSDGTTHYVYDGVVIEHHHLPFDPTDPKEIIVMTNLHILKHSMVNGVGLRQLCDMAVVYRHYSGKYDARSLRKIIEKKGLVKWTNLLDSTLVQYIGLSSDCLPWPLEDGEPSAVYEKDACRYMGMVMGDGNLGLFRKLRISVTARRLLLFFRYTPQYLVKRWIFLMKGRLLYRNNKAKIQLLEEKC